MLLEKPNYQWYAVYCKANSEKKISEKLIEKNIECYLPIRKVLRTWSDRKKWIEEPLFKSYIFVKVSYKEFFITLNTPGAVCFVSFGGKAQAIPEIQINNIRSLMTQTDHEVTLTYERIQKGVTVKVTNGSMKGVCGEVLNIYGQSRILIRVDSLSCSLYANISKEEVKVIEGKSQLHERAII